MSDETDGSHLRPASLGQVDSFLEKVARFPCVREKETGPGGRLLFAMDATASRQETWRQAMEIQSEMFLTAKALGGLCIQLAFYHGFGTFRAGPWLEDGDSLVRLMGSVVCRAGPTQIAKILKHGINESKQYTINAIVFVGDSFEEKADDVADLAGRLGILGVPVFIFHEGDEPHARSVFQDIARLSGGACVHFDARSPQALRALLNGVAAYATGGWAAVEREARKKVGQEALFMRYLLPRK